MSRNPRRARRQRLDAKTRRLKQAILQLPPDPRDVFLLHVFDRMTLAAIGDHFGMELDEVQAHMVEALLEITRATAED